jgi:4a-hydroxytetrahydrobiopterin dehydratase
MLSDLKCVKIEKGTPPLSADEARDKWNEISDWTLSDDKISRIFQFPDFRGSIQFVNKVAALANQEDHHPDIRISYNKVTLDLSTHRIGGLSLNDFILAAKINLIK